MAFIDRDQLQLKFTIKVGMKSIAEKLANNVLCKVIGTQLVGLIDAHHYKE